MIYGTVGTDHQEKQKGRGRGAIWIILPWRPPWRVLGENCLVCMALTSVGARGLLAWMVRGVVHTHNEHKRHFYIKEITQTQWLLFYNFYDFSVIN